MPVDAAAFENWREIRVDVDEAAAPDVVASLTDMRDVFEDHAADIVWCSHVIEHFYDHDVSLVLSEIARVLKPTGVAILKCPDLEQIMSLIDPDDLEKPLYQAAAGDISALDILYGHRRSIEQGNIYMAHHTGFTENSLAKRLLSAGFEEVQTQKSRSVDFISVASFGEHSYAAQVAELLRK